MEELHVGPGASEGAKQSFATWQDWTNKNIFSSSIDETLIRYQDQEDSAVDNVGLQGYFLKNFMKFRKCKRKLSDSAAVGWDIS